MKDIYEFEVSFRSTAKQQVVYKFLIKKVKSNISLLYKPFLSHVLFMFFLF